ncbi:hypothetical protein Scep_005195 [Stephania cephalantha]|uniref:Uncharacterized protein n=1 Tax=Stephania cephalantha TaxID=152367 RepID=A0AAP0PZV3_9MAGN
MGGAMAMAMAMVGEASREGLVKESRETVRDGETASETGEMVATGESRPADGGGDVGLLRRKPVIHKPLRIPVRSSSRLRYMGLSGRKVPPSNTPSTPVCIEDDADDFDVA